MKHKNANVSRGMQELCLKLKLQLDELSVRSQAELDREREAEASRRERRELLDKLKAQLAALS